MKRCFLSVFVWVGMICFFSNLAQSSSDGDVAQYVVDANAEACKAIVIAKTDYMVPLDDLQDSSAVFEMSNLRYQKCGDAIAVQYDLPENLTGEKNVVQMTGSFQAISSTVEVSSDQGNASCIQRTDGALKCNVQFKNLSLNPKKAQGLLLKENISAIDLNQKIDAIGRFTGNPVGFFTVQLQ